MNTNSPTPRLVPDRPSASDKLRSLAAVIRKHGTCAPAALEHVADEIDAAAAPPAEAPAERGHSYRHRWNADGERCVKCGDKDWMGGPCSKPDAVPFDGDLFASNLRSALGKHYDPEAGIVCSVALLVALLHKAESAPRVTGGRAEEWRAVETMLRNLGQPGMADSAAGFRIIEAEAVKQRLQAATGGEG